MGVEINVSLGAAFVAGVLSIFSPCIIPLLPVYVSQLSSSVAGPNRGGRGNGWEISIQAFIFVLGFAVVFTGMGLATSFIGQFLNFNRELLLKVGGVLVVLMGLNLMGLLPLSIFARHWSPLGDFRPPGFLRSFFLGTAFALGWTPCIGPVLASILALAAATGSTTAGGLLLAVYSLGMAIPFLVLCLTIDRIPGLHRIMGKYSRVSLLVSGFLLVILGVLMFFNRLQVLAAYLTF